MAMLNNQRVAYGPTLKFRRISPRQIRAIELLERTLSYWIWPTDDPQKQPVILSTLW